MSGPPFLKKPKVVIVKIEDEKEENGEGIVEERLWKEQEAALLALVEHRAKEVEQLRERVAYYKSQLDEALTRLMDTQTELSRHRGQRTSMTSETFRNCIKKVKESSASPANMSVDSVQSQFQYKPKLLSEDFIESSADDHRIEGAGFLCKNRDSSQEKYHSKPQLVIPSVNPSMSHPMTMKESGNKVSGDSVAFLTASIATQINSNGKQNGGKSHKTSLEQENMESQPNGTKRKHVAERDKDLIALIGSLGSPHRFHCQTVLLSSQHKRRLRSLELCPTNDNLFVTREIWKQTKASFEDKWGDVHTRLMRKNYDPVPQWWFYGLLIIVTLMSFVACEGFNRQLQLPYWGTVLAFALGFVFTLPIGVIVATANQAQMEPTPSEQMQGQGRKSDKSRRCWSMKEEEVLISALKDIVANGWKSENGFRTGYLIVLERVMVKAFPGTDLRAQPHINSKLHVWKKYHASLTCMLVLRGFSWNAKDKMVKAEDDAWESYLKGIEEYLYSRLELEAAILSAHEEISRKDEEILQLKDLVASIIGERDEMKAKCQAIASENQQLLQRLQTKTQPPSNCATSDDENMSLSPSDSATWSPSSSDKCWPCSKSLPPNGKFLQAVMEAGPLLHTLLLAGPLPRWQHPPPHLNSTDIPPVAISPTTTPTSAQHSCL
ncbi:hypothetical protein F511_02931 [Dorcoceras hygrometricum]|uniref:Myb/SANT-like domain-containing protein n=1 Tax=Dorcoceras hygrometricum TaxID=472368 RepID=A0A2Z7AJ83_9LAMI|nr:hypothetical protein F511_02931 [Dorcoceras hygrometricum]